MENHLESLSHIVQHRRSIRKYVPDSVPRHDIDRLLTLAGRAPSPWNLQPWRVVAVADPDAKAKLQQAAYNQPQVGSAPVVLVVYSDMATTLANLDEIIAHGLTPEAHQRFADMIHNTFAKFSPAENEVWGANQTGIFLGYLLLLIEVLGYTSSPMLGFAPDAVKEMFQLPVHVHINALVAIGKPAEEGKRSERRTLPNLVRWV